MKVKTVIRSIIWNNRDTNKFNDKRLIHCNQLDSNNKIICYLRKTILFQS